MITAVIAAVGVICIVSGGAAPAATIDLDLTVDIAGGTIQPNIDVNGFIGDKYVSSLITINPISLGSGDTLNIHFSFLPGQYLQMASVTGQYISGAEYIGFSLNSPQPYGGAIGDSTSTLESLSGLSGELLPALPVTRVWFGGFYQNTASGGILVANYTDTAFAFNDVAMSTVYGSLADGSVVTSGIYFIASAERISVPEPGIPLSLLSGLAGLFGMRRFFCRPR